MTQENFKTQYFDHYFGLSILNAENQKITFTEHEIILDPEHSREFCVGIARKKSRGTLPFLAGPVEDWDWLNSIQWKRIVLDPSRKKLCLVTQKISFNRMPTMTSISVSIHVQDPKKLVELSKFRYLELKHYWVENFKTLRIDNSKAKWRLPVKLKKPDEPLLSDEEMTAATTANDLIQQALAETNVYQDPNLNRRSKK